MEGSTNYYQFSLKTLDYAHQIIIDVQAGCVLWQIGGQVVELQMGTVDSVEGQALGQHVMQQAAAVLQIHMCLTLASQQLR